MSNKIAEQGVLPKRVSRRQFSKAAVATIVAASVAPAQTATPTPKEAAAPPKPQESPAPPQPSPTAAAYLALVAARFGNQFTPEQLTEIKGDIEGIIRNSDRFKIAKLQNGDEPDFVFAA